MHKTQYFSRFPETSFVENLSIFCYASVVYNMHSLIHLPVDVLVYGPVNTLSWKFDALSQLRHSRTTQSNKTVVPPACKSVDVEGMPTTTMDDGDSPMSRCCGYQNPFFFRWLMLCCGLLKDVVTSRGRPNHITDLTSGKVWLEFSQNCSNFFSSPMYPTHLNIFSVDGLRQKVIGVSLWNQQAKVFLMFHKVDQQLFRYYSAC